MQMHTSDTDFSEESRDTLLGMLDEMIADSDQGNSWITDSEKLRATQPFSSGVRKHLPSKMRTQSRAFMLDTSMLGLAGGPP